MSHIHTNGHNFKSWLAIAVTAWVGFFFGLRNIATVHSGLMPEYAAGGRRRKLLIRAAVWPLGGVIAVNQKIERALLEMTVSRRRVFRSSRPSPSARARRWCRRGPEIIENGSPPSSPRRFIWKRNMEPIYW
ncbi:MAG: hypothetical protein MPW15_27840 [Candidatus Manganitrophus sp.]|nr:hypothetical protein [Candidatus Manganitrophus sp.]